MHFFCPLACYIPTVSSPFYSSRRQIWQSVMILKLPFVLLYSYSYFPSLCLSPPCSVSQCIFLKVGTKLLTKDKAILRNICYTWLFKYINTYVNIDLQIFFLLKRVSYTFCDTHSYCGKQTFMQSVLWETDTHSYCGTQTFMQSVLWETDTHLYCGKQTFMQSVLWETDTRSCRPYCDRLKNFYTICIVARRCTVI
jgi:hypothetical protein